MAAGRERDRLILLMIARYGLVTARVLHHVLFRDLTIKAVERVLGRLLRQGRICSHPLYGKTRYYTLTGTSAREFGLNDSRVMRPMGTQALVQNYSIILYCTMGDVPRERLTRAEFAARFPFLQPTGDELDRGLGKGLSTNRYYLDADGGPDPRSVSRPGGGKVRLALLVPDFKRHPRRLIRKARNEVLKRRAISSFKEFIDLDLFSITVLTPFPEKAAFLKDALPRFLREPHSREPWHSRVEVVPEFAQLLVPGG